MATSARTHRHVVAACYLGWTLDAFDFFIMVFVFGDVAREFHAGDTSVAFAVTLTLATRAVGAFLFGRLADRFGRRPALMGSILGYSLFGFCTGLAPNLTVFLILRACFGVAMGGEWGIGASLTMESIPASWRGTVSGLLQTGYPTGYLLASLLYGVAYDWVHWRGMFMLGAVPALLVLYIRRSVPESPGWLSRAENSQRPTLSSVLRGNLRLTLYVVLMMTCFNFLSHGTQDLFPHYLQTQHNIHGVRLTEIAVVYNIGAILGGLCFGRLSQRIGRRKAISLAVLMCLPLLPLWAFSSTPAWIGLGAFLMQFFVQGAWGVIPAHLNELSPPEIRGTFPGVTYQLGNLLASVNLPLQTAIASHAGGDFRWPLMGVAGVAAILIALLMTIGREARELAMSPNTA